MAGRLTLTEVGVTLEEAPQVIYDLRRKLREMTGSGGRIDLRCPLCGGTVNVGLTIDTRLIHTPGNGRKGYLTATASVGGMEHTCPSETEGSGA